MTPRPRWWWILIACLLASNVLGLSTNTGWLWWLNVLATVMLGSCLAIEAAFAFQRRSKEDLDDVRARLAARADVLAGVDADALFDAAAFLGDKGQEMAGAPDDADELACVATVSCECDGSPRRLGWRSSHDPA